MTEVVQKDKRNQAFDQVLIKYQELGTVIQSIPYDQTARSLIHQYFDTGFLWAKEALACIPDSSFEEKKEEVIEAEVIEAEIVDPA